MAFLHQDALSGPGRAGALANRIAAIRRAARQARRALYGQAGEIGMRRWPPIPQDDEDTNLFPVPAAQRGLNGLRGSGCVRSACRCGRRPQNNSPLSTMVRTPKTPSASASSMMRSCSARAGPEHRPRTRWRSPDRAITPEISDNSSISRS